MDKNENECPPQSRFLANHNSKLKLHAQVKDEKRKPYECQKCDYKAAKKGIDLYGMSQNVQYS